MPLYVIILIIVALYWKTCGAYFLIDDYTPRHQYPHPEAQSKAMDFYLKKPHWWVHPFMITMHCVNTSVMYLLWGWGPALLFAVHPMSMWAAAWLTGNWYCTTTYFLLISYYFMHTFNGVWADATAIWFFWVAMHSTFDAIPYPFVLIMSGNPLGWVMLPFLGAFLNGKKFREGLAGRANINDGKVIDRKDLPFNRLSLMTKVVAKYTYETMVPMKVKMFDNYAEDVRNTQKCYDEVHAWDKHFWASAALILAVFALCYLGSPTGAFWWFIMIALHSQFNLMGQFYAQRYIYIALPGLCAALGTILMAYPIVLMAIAGFFACRTYLGMGKWMTMENFLLDETTQCPDRGDNYNLVGQFYLCVLPLEGYQPYMINMISYCLRKACVLAPESWQAHMNLSAYLCKIGHVDEGLAMTDKTIELIRKYSGNREKHLIDTMIEQRNNWTKIGKDLKLRKELYQQTGRDTHNMKIIGDENEFKSKNTKSKKAKMVSGVYSGHGAAAAQDVREPEENQK